MGKRLPIERAMKLILTEKEANDRVDEVSEYDAHISVNLECDRLRKKSMRLTIR